MSLINSDDDRIIFFVIIFAIIFFGYLPSLENKYNSDVAKLKNNSEVEKEIEKMSNTLFHNLKCSNKCCDHKQYLPKELQTKKDDKIVGSNLTCNSGCLCTEKKDLDILTNRGGNNK